MKCAQRRIDAGTDHVVVARANVSVRHQLTHVADPRVYDIPLTDSVDAAVERARHRHRE